MSVIGARTAEAAYANSHVIARSSEQLAVGTKAATVHPAHAVGR